GRFHGVATKYLDHYLGWRRLLDRFQDSVTAQQFLFHALRPEYVNT
nr:IS1595 family transposase [Gammaproteobacteria bacterium]